MRIVTVRFSPCLVAAALLGCLAMQAAAAVDQVIVVFKTHFDIGYTDMASNVVKRYRTTMIDDALKVVDQNRGLPPEQQFAWTLPGWPLSKIMEDWPGQSTQRQARVRQAFKDGRFVVHALPFTTHTELLEPEDLVRGLGFASRLSRSVDLELPRDAKMTDVPCHSWIMPTLLKHAGVDFLHLGCNAASSSPRVPKLFLWEGPDGSRLLTMYTAESYGTGLVPPKDWPYKTWLALIHTGDNHGPPTPDEVKKLLAEAEQKLPGVKVRIGRLSDFGDAILVEKADIPLVRGDMPDTWIHGPMSDPQGAQIARNIRPAIATAESLNTMLRLWGVDVPDAAPTIAQAYEQSLLYGEHTWGGAQYWVTKYGAGTKWSYGDGWKADRAAGRFQRLEDSWAEHTAYIENAQRMIQPVLQSELNALARAVAKDGPRIVVYNPLPLMRYSSLVAADVEGTPWSKHTKGGLSRMESTELQVFACDGKTMLVEVDEIPPMGYATLLDPDPMNTPEFWYFPENDPVSHTLGTGRGLRLNPMRGAIASLPLLPHKECVDIGSPFGFGQVLYERFDSNDVASYVRSYVKISADWAVNELGKPTMPPAQIVSYRASSPTNFSVDYTNSWLAAEAVMKAPATNDVPFGVTTRVKLLNFERPFIKQAIDIEITIHGKPADPWPEAAWLCLPFNIPSPQFRIGRLGSIIDPAKDIVPGANQNLFAVDTGIAIIGEDGSGVGICPLDSPLVSLGEPGCWKYTTNSNPKNATVFINLFNNQWTTNFRMWNQGTWTSRVRIWAFRKYDPTSSLIRPSLDARYPLQAAYADGPGGRLPLTGQGVSVSPSGSRVLVTAFGSNPDGPGTLLRLWEMAGQSGAVTVTLPPQCKATQVQPVNLRGVPQGKPIVVNASQFTFDLPAFAPASFIFN